MRWEKRWLTGNVGLYLVCEFKDSVSIFDQFSPRNCVEC